MKLNLEQIKSVTVGAVRIWEENGSVRFAKCTQKQVDAWYAFEQVLGERAETTTGIRLDLHTNSSFFGFTAAKGGKFEIYVNNVLLYNLTAKDLTDGSYRINLDKSACEENRITLYLPSHEVGILSSVELEDGASLRPHTFEKKLLFIGDSITQGWNSGYDSLSYAYRTSRAFNANSVIYGVGGGFFDPSVLDDEFDFDPDAVIIAYGTNDWGRCPSLEVLVKNTSDFLDKLSREFNGKPIICISPIWRADTNQTKRSGTFEEVCAAVKAQIKAHGMYLVEGEYLVPHLTEFFADGFLHPNALGFGSYSENLVREIKDLI